MVRKSLRWFIRADCDGIAVRDTVLVDAKTKLGREIGEAKVEDKPAKFIEQLEVLAKSVAVNLRK